MILFYKEQSPPISTTHNSTKDKSLPLAVEKASKANGELLDAVQDSTDYLSFYEKSDIVFSCVSFASDIISQINFNIEEIKNGENIPIKDEKILNWFLQPNPFQSMAEVIYLYMQSYFLTGNSYLTFEKVGGKIESWVIPPNKIKIVPDKKQYIKGFLVADKIAYKPNEIIFFKNPSLSNNYYGQSYLATAIDPLKIEGYVVEDLLTFYDNSLIAQGIFTSEFPLTKEQIDNLHEQFEALYGRTGRKRHGHLIVPNNLKYQSMKLNPKDGLLLDSLNISAEKIYKIFRLSPSLLGNPANGTDVNGTELKEYKKIYINNFIRPIINRLVKQWETFFRKITKNPNIVITPDYRGIPEVNTALEEKIDSVKQAVSIGLLNHNEGRKEVGYKPVEGEYMDAYFAPSYLTGTNPLDLVSGDSLNLSPSNSNPNPQSSSSPDGGSDDGVNR